MPRLPGKKELALLAGSILFAALVAEAALRVAGIAYPIFHRLEALRGWAPWPGAEGRYVAEGEAHISINKEGFRDSEHPVQKPENTFRIAVLGDSFAEARGIPIDKTFWSVLGRRLERCASLAGKRIEVLNFGVSGYGTAQELLTWRAHARKYRPDIVLLAFYVGNDVWNNERALDGHPDRVYARMRSGKLAVDDSNTARSGFAAKAALRNGVNAVVNASRLLQVGRKAYYDIKIAYKHRRPPEGGVFNARAPQNNVYRTPDDPIWRRAWAATEAILKTIDSEVRDAGGTFWLVSLTTPPQVHPDAAARRRFMRALGVANLTEPETRLAAIARRSGIAYLPLAEPMRRISDAEGLYLHGFETTTLGRGHWNPNGHRIAGELMAREICRRGPVS